MVWEFSRYINHVSREDFANIVHTLFYEACDGGIYAEVLRADVFADCTADELIEGIPESRACENDPRHAFRISCNTSVDGSTIDAHILINGRYFRTMNIAS